MKRLSVLLVIILVLVSLVISCSSKAPSSTTSQTTAGTTTTTSSSAIPITTTSTTKPPVQPVYGGILRGITDSFPKVIGYPVEFAPADSIYALPALESLNEWDSAGKDTPVLAESWDPDPVNKTLTWHLRKDVKFQDGTDWNAEALRWNFQMLIDAKKLTNVNDVISLEVIDQYTLKMNLKTYNRFMPMDFGWSKMISPTAFTNAGNGDIEKSKEWARLNSVGTGAFKVTNFVRDTSITYVKNPNYWRKGMPYLDGMEFRLIPDIMTANAMMQSKQADIWVNLQHVQTINELQQKGFTINQAPGFSQYLLPNSSDPNSPFAKKGVREAIEYAINRPALADMIGPNQYEAMNQMIPPNTPGNVKGYDPRPYNPNKAKQLLADAGYPNGFQTKILATSSAQDPVAGISAYLKVIGIDATIDIADMGRYFGAVFGTGWPDLAFAVAGGGTNISILFDHFGPSPKTFRSGSIYKSPEYLALCNEAFTTLDDAKALAVVEKAVQQAGSDAMVVPIYKTALVAAVQPNVHSDYYQDTVAIVWHSYSQWIDKK